MKYCYLLYRIVPAALLLFAIACNNDDLEGYLASKKQPTSVNKDNLAVEPESLYFEASGGKKTIAVTSNTSWSVNSNSEEWCAIEGDHSGTNNGTVIVVVKENLASGPARDAVITISSSSKSCVVNVHQDKGPDKDIPGADDNPNPSY